MREIAPPTIRDTKNIDSSFFYDYAGRRIRAREVVTAIASFMSDDPSRQYKIIVGSDSEAWMSDAVDFVSAVVVHRVGNGGRYFWRRIAFPRFHTLRDRIVQEALLSIGVAQELLALLKAYEVARFDFEIHVDVGENGATKAVIAEVVGMIRAYDFEAKTKPESYAASKVADRHV